MIWKKVKLSEICHSISDGDHQPPPKTTAGIPFVTISNITNTNQFDFSSTMFVPQEYYDNLDSKRKPQIGDILYSVVGSFGIPVYMKEEARFVFQRHIAILRPNTDKVEPQFLYYSMLSRDFYMKADAAAIGAAQRTVSLTALRSMEIDIPPVTVQKKIVDALSAFDDLIENNQKQIKLLEEAARRLYKEWFVDLHFPGYENVTVVDGVPEGWRWCKLEDAIIFDPKIKLDKNRIKQSIPMSALSTTSMVLNSNDFTETTSNSGSKFQNGDTLLARITPCLENGKTAFVWGIDSDEGAVGSTEYIVMRSRTLNPYMVYLLARTDNFRQTAINSMSGSDGRQRVKADKLRSINYLHPSDRLITAFTSITQPIFQKIFGLNHQCKMAARARDYLLPKLMSGELELESTNENTL